MHTATAPQFVDEKRIAELFPLSRSFLQKDRSKARRIPYCKVGGKVLYRPDAVAAALDAMTVGGLAPKGRR